MDELNLADIQQQYWKNMVMYKGEPVFVKNVEGKDEIIIQNLLSWKEAVVPFNLNDFQPHKGRLGMVNFGKSCAYLSRIPARKMGIGLNSSNAHAIGITELHAPSAQTIVRNVLILNIKELGLTIAGKYPTFKEARDEVFGAEEGCHIRAFDRQFAISSSKSIYYKGQLVGTVAKRAATVRDIKFMANFEHLEQLL